MMQNLDKGTLISNIERGYFHNPYIAKLSCVDIIQFIEKFIRFDLYPSIQLVGVKDQREWERLVRNYLEEIHSFIDIQRKIAMDYSRVMGIDDIKHISRPIIEPIPIESKIIQEVRRQIHHASIHIIAIGSYGGPSGCAEAIPLIIISENWFSDETVKTRVREIMNDPKLLWHLFAAHCDHFVTTSNAIGNALFEKLGRQPILHRG